MSSLSAEQLDDLQSFLKDWLRHAGRTQADLRRALRASSIRMPVLVEELRQLHDRHHRHNASTSSAMPRANSTVYAENASSRMKPVSNGPRVEPMTLAT